MCIWIPYGECNVNNWKLAFIFISSNLISLFFFKADVVLEIMHKHFAIK